MNLQAFTKLLSAHLYPLLREEGFRGSGATLRRLNAPLAHVFNVQGSASGQRCYLNLGAHLAFLSSDRQSDWRLDRVLEYQCAFRTRIDPPAGQDFGWSYGSSISEAEANVSAAVTAWKHQGKSFFAQFATYPEDFARRVAEFSPDEAHPAMCLTMARIAVQLGEPGRASAIAASGLDRVAERATVLRKSLNQVLVGNNAP